MNPYNFLFHPGHKLDGLDNMPQACHDSIRIADDDVRMILPYFGIEVVEKIPDHRIVKRNDVFFRIAFDKP